MAYDLIVIGSGPGGQKAAIAAAKLGKKVAIIERQRELLGGVCLHSGTIPSKTIREAILHLTGYRQREVYADQYRQKRSITMKDLRRKLKQVSDVEWEVIQDQFERNNIEVFIGEASFVGPHEVLVQQKHDRVSLEGEKILIASGTRTARPAHIPFDGKTIFDSDEILLLEEIPRSMIAVGGGVIGLEYAIMFATLGVKVTVIDGRENLLEFCDREIVDTLLHHARSLGIMFRLGENVIEITKVRENLVSVLLESGKHLLAETTLFSVGREGDTDQLNVAAAGLTTNNRGRLTCSKNFQTEVPHIYAVGDVVGFPSLASASMEQGRCAVAHAFGVDFTKSVNLPYGLYTIPEISVIGKNEQELTKECVPYEIGVARYSEIARGHIVGDQTGMLKLIFHRETLEILGVHCIGEMATEIIHIGQAVMTLGGTICYFTQTVFNYPTMTECYKVAALDGLNKSHLQKEVKGIAAEKQEAKQEIEAEISTTLGDLKTLVSP